ncbi:hypothetical protein B0H19DRAFT_1248685 [Mycena capillaripes]|nr:hypothetical protein B0H19DRAFT_1248685 [Mycena capillaripes]
MYRASAHIDDARCKPSNAYTSAIIEDLLRNLGKYALWRPLPDLTRQNSPRTLEAFRHFCDEQDVASEDRLPASESLLCAFAVSRAGGVSGSTVRDALEAVEAWHLVNNAEWKGGYVCVAKPETQPPLVTIDMLNLLDTKTTQKARGLRGSVLRPLGSSRTQQARSNPGASLPDSRPRATLESNRVAGEKMLLCRRYLPSDPIHAVEHHLVVNRIPFNLPLFSYRNREYELLCLTYKTLLRRCNEIWARHEYPAHTGYSFRVGGMTELLLAGVNRDIVQVMGRWDTETFKVHLQQLHLQAP